MSKTNHGAHDLGGAPAGPVDAHEHTPTLTERRIDALMQLLRLKPRAFWITDENRRTIESLTPETYRASGYYEKWAYAMRSLLVEKGVLAEAEIARRLAEVKARHGARTTDGKVKSGKAQIGRAGKAKASGASPAKATAAKAPASRPGAKKSAAARRGRP